MKRRGFTLTELLVVISVLMMLLALGATLLLGAMRADQLAADTLQRVARHATIADQFRDDVHAAVELPAKQGEFTVGPGCLILRVGDSRWVIYEAQPGKLVRTERAGGSDRRQVTPFAVDDGIAEFATVGGVVRLRLIESFKYGGKRVIDIDAAKGVGP